MSDVVLTVTDPGGSRQVRLEPKGTLIGRSQDCHIVLNSPDVSRKHARIFRDPFDRWIIEDLGSNNGIIVNDERVQAYALLPGETVCIGSCCVSMEPPLAKQIERDDSVNVKSNFIRDDFKAQIISGEAAGTEQVLSRPYLKQLNEINSRLSELNSPSALYPEVCKSLAQAPKTIAAVLRLPGNKQELPESPEILACHLGGSSAEITAEDMTNLYLSHRVLEAVRYSGNPVMAKSVRTQDADMVLTISDEQTPRVVICVPLGPVTEEVDLLYIDTLIEHTTPDTFEFIQAVARQVVLTRKNLIFGQAKAERQMLDNQLRLAREIQTKLAPGVPESGFAVDIAVCYKPAMWVGGDYYDVWTLDNGKIAFAVGDVSGKGLPAAMIMSNLQAALRTTMTFCSDLATVAEHINRHLCRNLKDDMFVTFFLGLFDPSENKLAYVNAGHIPPIIMHPSEPARTLSHASNMPLGIFESPFVTAEEAIDPKTGLLVVTDGITEANSPNGEMFEIERLTDLMTKSKAASAKTLIQVVMDTVIDFRQTMPQQDDITVFALLNQKAMSAA